MSVKQERETKKNEIKSPLGFISTKNLFVEEVRHKSLRFGTISDVVSKDTCGDESCETRLCHVS